MLVPVDPSSILGPLAGGAALCFIGVLFVASAAFPRDRVRFWRKSNPARELIGHRCHYCRWGHARLIQEKVTREKYQIVEVRLYACTSCGLPHWTVRRVPITELARW